jgi:hypothetical protein
MGICWLANGVLNVLVLQYVPQQRKRWKTRGVDRFLDEQGKITNTPSSSVAIVC